MTWTGQDLVNEYCEAFGFGTAPTTAQQTRVLKFMNDILDDISGRHSWAHLKARGSKILTAGSEDQTLTLDAPAAPTAASSSGGSLATGSSYRVLVTFYRSTDRLESPAGTISSAVTVNSPNLQLSLTAIPVSTETSVTARRIYLSKDSGAFLYNQTISDNTTTTATVSLESTSMVSPQPHAGIRMMIGNPWIESVGRWLEYLPEDAIRQYTGNTIQSGVPQQFDFSGFTTLLLYPKPSDAFSMRFSYIRLPKRFVLDQVTEPDLPVQFKQALEYGVFMKNYQFRERELFVSYKGYYEQEIQRVISNLARLRLGDAAIRDVVGDTDGDVYL